MQHEPLKKLLAFRGPPTEFWAAMAESMAQSVQGELVVLYARQPGDVTQDHWQPVSYWPQLKPEKLSTLLAWVDPELIARARVQGVATGLTTHQAWQLGVLVFQADEGRSEFLLVVHIPHVEEVSPQVRQTLAQFQTAPLVYESQRKRRQSERDALRLAEALELLGRVLTCHALDQAALVLVNELSERFACETVSLSWHARGGLHLRGISHAEKPDRRSELSALLEEAGQEAVSQASEVHWPGTGKVVTRAHERYAALQNPGHMLTLPLIRDGKPLGAISLERHRMAFTAAETWALRMMADLVQPLLMQLDVQSLPLHKRLGREIWHSLPARFKPHTYAGHQLVKGLAIGLAVLLLLPVPYAVDAGATVKTDAMAFVGAPFDGFLESSQSSLGKTVKAGDVLFGMATRELLLERAGILADIAQYSREAEKRRSVNQLPEMLIAESQMMQAASRLKQVDHRLASAQAPAPIDGVVVEGEPGKNLGGAVRRGEVVVKVAALKQLYVEAAVNQRDLSRIAVDQSVRLTLLADTGHTYRLQLTRVVPASAVKDGENTFPVRLETLSPAPDWWRPGMTGVAKIEVGWRPIIWIATHRLVDYLRMALWFW
jgi:biotin carboxyl carrier protein